MFHKKVVVTALGLAMAATTAGLLASAAGGAAHAQRTVGYLRSGGGFDDAVLQGAQTAATALGDRLDIENADETPQISAIDAFIAQRVNAIAVHPDEGDTALLEPALAQARAAGIATLSLVEAVPGSVWVNQSGSAQYAQALADALAAQMGDKGQYAIVGQQDQFPIATQWQRLIKSYVAKHYPRMKLVKVVRGTGGGDQAEVAIVKRFMAAHPKLRGLVGLTPTEGYTVAAAIIQARKVGKVFGSGNCGFAPVDEPLATYIRHGAEQVVCAGDPVKLGYLTVWAADYLAGGHTFAPGSYQVGGPVGTVEYFSRNDELRLGQPLTITQANIDQYAGP